MPSGHPSGLAELLLAAVVDHVLIAAIIPSNPSLC